MAKTTYINFMKKFKWLIKCNFNCFFQMLVISTVTFTLLVHTGCYTPVSDEYMTLQDLLKLHRKGPISLEFPAGLSARKYHVIKRQDGGSSESVIDRTVVTQMCDQLNKTHLILDNILAQVLHVAYFFKIIFTLFII